MRLKKAAVFLFAICIITVTSIGAYTHIAHISQDTEPEEVILSDLIPKELDYETAPVNQSQAEERAKDLLNKLGLEYNAITKTELLGTDMISFWKISFDNYKYLISINSKTGTIYSLSTSYMIIGEDIDKTYVIDKNDYFSEYVIVDGRKETKYNPKLSNNEAEEYAKEIFMKIPLEKNTYTSEVYYAFGTWNVQFKTKIDGFETRYKEVIITFMDSTKQIVGIELNSDDIYDNNEVVISKEDVEQLMKDYIESIKSENSFEVKYVRLGISYVDPLAINNFNRDYMLTEDERIELGKRQLNKQLLLEDKLNDGDIKLSPFEKWAEIYGSDTTLMFFGGNIFRKVWYVDIEAKIDYDSEVYKLTVGIDATNKMIVFYGDTDVNMFDSKPAKRSGGMAI